MGFLDKAKEFWRDKRGDEWDKIRDDLYAFLFTIGVDANIAKRGQPEEHITWFGGGIDRLDRNKGQPNTLGQYSIRTRSA